MPAASQFQEGIYVALGEMLAARPHVGDEAAGALGTEGEVGFDLLHPAHYLGLTSRTVLFARPADGQFNPAGQFPSVTCADGALCGAVRGPRAHSRRQARPESQQHALPVVVHRVLGRREGDGLRRLPGVERDRGRHPRVVGGARPALVRRR